MIASMNVKDFPDLDQSVYIAGHGSPVHIDGVGDIEAALTYSNDNSVKPYVPNYRKQIGGDVNFTHAVVFPFTG